MRPSTRHEASCERKFIPNMSKFPRHGVMIVFRSWASILPDQSSKNSQIAIKAATITLKTIAICRVIFGLPSAPSAAVGFAG